MLRATMSTLPSCSTGIRWAAVITRSSIWFGSPKIACEISCSMSMSKPSIFPEIGLRAPSSRVSAETPTISRPRFWILRHGGAGGHLARSRAGCRRGVGLQAVRRGDVGAGGRGRRGAVPRLVDGAAVGLGVGSGVGGVVTRGRARAQQRGRRPSTAQGDRRGHGGAGSSVLLQPQRDAPPGRHRGDEPGQQRRGPRRAVSQPPASSSCGGGLLLSEASCSVGAGVEAAEGGVARPGPGPGRQRDRAVPVAGVVERRGSAGGPSAYGSQGRGSRSAEAGFCRRARTGRCARRCRTSARPPRTRRRSRGR